MTFAGGAFQSFSIQNCHHATGVFDYSRFLQCSGCNRNAGSWSGIVRSMLFSTDRPRKSVRSRCDDWFSLSEAIVFDGVPYEPVRFLCTRKGKARRQQELCRPRSRQSRGPGCNTEAACPV